jgi:hypothetical protein
MNKSKRTRTSFTVEQLEGLEKYFKENQYVTSSDRKIIADRLALSETQVSHFRVGIQITCLRACCFGAYALNKQCHLFVIIILD